MKIYRFYPLLIAITIIGGCSKNDIPSLSSFGKLQIIKSGLNYIVASCSISDSGHQKIISKGFCWSKKPDPNIDSNSFITSLSQLSSFSDTIKGLTYNTQYYIRAFATNSIGTSYSKVDSVITLQTIYSYGQHYGGGYIFYIDSTGEHGLIASRTIGHSAWGAWWTRFHYFGTSKVMGSGQHNTKMLVDSAGTDAYAASFCDKLVEEGYNDWFLPSEDELWLLGHNLQQQNPIIGYYPGDLYWSSSEVAYPQYQYAAWLEAIYAWADFTSDDKQYDHGIIPVRKF